MVRNLVGTLLAICEQNLEPSKIEELIESQDRTKAFKTINPEGLYLADVIYEDIE